MNPEHLRKLSADFNLGSIDSVTEVTEGILNKNYILTTSNGKYFIKEVREKSKDLLPATALVEDFMRERGIPAICMIPSAAGHKFVMYDSNAYSLYSFLESDRSHNYSLEDYRNMGALLGKIHIAGSKDIPELLTRRSFREKPKEGELAKIQEYKARIQNKEMKDPIDEEFIIYTQLKLDLISTLSMNPVLPSDTLAHGDYQAGNLLIDINSREIVGVCDWEKAEMAPRAAELARAILYISFSGDYTEESGIVSANQIIAGYNSVYAISRQELLDGLEIRLRRMVLTSWLENHYYDMGDARGNHFVSHEARLLRDFIQGELIQKLIV
jgi:Ser/Thr protein kinase RdoA (MazF antagonist)